MDTKSEKSKENWLKFDFPAECVLDEPSKEFLKKAAGSNDGTCCPYYFCDHKKGGAPCGLKTAKTCAERCEKFYEKYIKG